MGSVRRTVLPNRTRPSTITADVQPTSHFRIADLQCELAWSPSCVATAWRAVPDGLSPVRRQGLCSTPCGPSPCPKPGPIRSPCVSNCRDSQGTARASGRQEHAVRRRGLCHVGRGPGSLTCPRTLVAKQTEGLADALASLFGLRLELVGDGGGTRTSTGDRAIASRGSHEGPLGGWVVIGTARSVGFGGKTCLTEVGAQGAGSEEVHCGIGPVAE